MAIMECPDCKGKVSTEAVACPHCGKPNDVKLSGPLKISYAETYFQINRHTADVLQICAKAASTMGLKYATGPTWIQIQGKMWSHNNSELLLSCEENSNELTTVNYIDRTPHFGPGIGKLTREYIAALKSVAK